MTRVFAIAALALALAPRVSARPLDIYFIDVEGGQSTLIVTPAGESLLVDAGYGARGGRDPDRIMRAVHDAHINKIDYVLLTHFHADHIGGVALLADRIPIGTFIDVGAPLGDDRLATNAFPGYEPVRSRGRHLTPKPGDRLPLKGLDVVFISADGVVLSAPLPGAGQPNPSCPPVPLEVDRSTENYRSVGIRLRMGAFSFLDLGDLSNGTLASVVCPDNLVGEISVYLVSHHGNLDSNVPMVTAAIHPRVAVMNNGATKGGAPESLETLQAAGLEDLWQLHASMNEGAKNAPDSFLANVDEGATGFWVKLSAQKNGRFTVVNQRTGFTKTYPKKRPRRGK
jgi:competence protein ComEC